MCLFTPSVLFKQCLFCIKKICLININKAYYLHFCIKQIEEISLNDTGIFII